MEPRKFRELMKIKKINQGLYRYLDEFWGSVKEAETDDEVQEIANVLGLRLKKAGEGIKSAQHGLQGGIKPESHPFINVLKDETLELLESGKELPEEDAASEKSGLKLKSKAKAVLDLLETHSRMRGKMIEKLDGNLTGDYVDVFYKLVKDAGLESRNIDKVGAPIVCNLAVTEEFNNVVLELAGINKGLTKIYLRHIGEVGNYKNLLTDELAGAALGGLEKPCHETLKAVWKRYREWEEKSNPEHPKVSVVRNHIDKIYAEVLANLTEDEGAEVFVKPFLEMLSNSQTSKYFEGDSTVQKFFRDHPEHLIGTFFLLEQRNVKDLIKTKKREPSPSLPKDYKIVAKLLENLHIEEVSDPRNFNRIIEKGVFPATRMLYFGFFNYLERGETNKTRIILDMTSDEGLESGRKIARYLERLSDSDLASVDTEEPIYPQLEQIYKGQEPEPPEPRLAVRQAPVPEPEPEPEPLSEDDVYIGIRDSILHKKHEEEFSDEIRGAVEDFAYEVALAEFPDETKKELMYALKHGGEKGKPINRAIINNYPTEEKICCFLDGLRERVQGGNIPSPEDVLRIYQQARPNT